MTYEFFFISKEDAKDGTKLGYSFAKAHQNEWVSKSGNEAMNDVVADGQTGVVFVVHDGIVYQLYKKYVEIDNNKVIVLCTESTYGSDTKVF